MAAKKIAVLVGSLRKESFTRKVAKEVIRLAPDSLALEIVEIGDLAHYNEDLEAEAPAAWTAFRDKLKACDGVLFFTPEYNRSIPGVLKNAIDVGSRPKKDNVWNGKVGAVISVTPGALGAFGANHHLRQTLVSPNMILLAQPEAYISNVKKLFTENGTLVEDTQQFIKLFLGAFETLLNKLS